jgi:hypothetical protein
LLWQETRRWHGCCRGRNNDPSPVPVRPSVAALWGRFSARERGFPIIAQAGLSREVSRGRIARRFLSRAEGVVERVRGERA